MIMFWVFSIAMIVIALVFLVRPLRRAMHQNDVDRTAQNVAITKERLNELTIELEQAVISQTEYEQAKQELEYSLLNDVEQENVTPANNPSYNHITRLVLVFSVPILAVSLYGFLGKPELIVTSNNQTTIPAHASANGAGNANLVSVEELVEKLAARLKQQPDDAEGWFMLGRSYMSLNRYKEAAIALEKTNQLVPNTPTIMLRYADALSMSRGGQISGKPFKLIKKAIAIKPDDPTGLWLLGKGYDEQGEYQKAISYWNLLLALLKDDKSINEVQNLIRHAKIKSGVNVAQELKSVSIVAKIKPITSLKIKVSIDKKLLKDVSENDVVFIFAKAINGPPMPLAVVRKQVKDLPLEVVLDDSMAMIPNMMLSSFNKVKITARISKSGKPLLQKNDFYSKGETIQLPFTGFINIKIDLIAE